MDHLPLLLLLLLLLLSTPLYIVAAVVPSPSPSPSLESTHASPPSPLPSTTRQTVPLNDICKKTPYPDLCMAVIQKHTIRALSLTNLDSALRHEVKGIELELHQVMLREKAGIEDVEEPDECHFSLGIAEHQVKVALKAIRGKAPDNGQARKQLKGIAVTMENCKTDDIPAQLKADAERITKVSENAVALYDMVSPQYAAAAPATAPAKN